MPMVKLNVGGRMFRTSESTLRACGDFCARLLDGEIPVDRDEDGVLFLDRDPDLFDWVLRFARTGEIQKDMPGALKAEFDFLLLSWPPCCQRCGVYFDTARNSDTSCRHHRFPWLEDVEISREDRACCPWPERSEKGCCKNCGTEICGRQVFKSYVRRYICCKGRIDEPGCRRCRHELPPDPDPSLEVLGGLAFVLVALLGPVAPSSVRAEEVEAVEVQDPAQKRKEEQERRKAEAKAKREEEEQRRKEVAEKRQAEAQKAREEAEAKRKAQAEEAAKKKEEAEKARAEEAAKRKAEEEKKKQEQEAKRQEEAKKREEAEKARAEEAAKRKAEEEEKKKEAE
ncbi:unnamed protein product, partial [Symbiodinium sp. KB8]